MLSVGDLVAGFVNVPDLGYLLGVGVVRQNPRRQDQELHVHGWAAAKLHCSPCVCRSLNVEEILVGAKER
jgi:hypothetical protein